MKKKVNKNYKYNNNKRQTNKFSKNPEVKKILLKNVSEASGKVAVIGRVNRILQTAGPTIFMVNDGTASLALKGFIKPGERAYPDIQEDSIVRAIIEVGEFRGELEGDIKNMYELSGNQKTEFLRSIEEIERKRARVTQDSFLVENKILDKLKKEFIKAATEIRLAIIQDRPIIVRHHNDADGYSSGFALELAIIPLIESQHNSEKAAWEFFTRAPCAAPFYEIDDSIIDTANSLRNVAKFSNKMPLIIIADNGSSEQDLMGIKQGKVHGSDFIVVDHHAFDRDVISDEVKVHINPFLVGEDGSHYSAGMLCAELARFINPDVKNISQIPALAGFADMIDLGNPEVMKKYLKIAEKEGYTKELLSDIALVIDYVSAKVRFMEVREYIEVLFGEPRNKQKALVKLMSPYIRDLDLKGLSIGKSNAIIDKIGKTTLQLINIEDIFPGFGFFPKPGRAVGLVHDDLKNSGKVKDNAIVTVGIMRTAITIRATDEADFSVQDLIAFLNKRIPEAFISGGGHKNAGSISFLPYKQREVVKLLGEFIRKR